MKKALIIFLIFLMMTTITAEADIVMILLGGDWHLSDRPYVSKAGEDDDEDGNTFNRDTQSASDRLDTFIAREKQWLPNLTINGGDFVDGWCGEHLVAGAIGASKIARGSEFMDAIKNESTGISGDIMHIRGNHVEDWDGTANYPTNQDYFDKVAEKSITEANVNGSGGFPWNYTYDTDGIRFIVLYAPQSGSFPWAAGYSGYGAGSNDDQITWLQARLDECDGEGQPCIIVSHAPLWRNEKMLIFGNPNPTSFILDEEDWATMSSIYDSTDTLQAVIAFHYHYANNYMHRNGVHYIPIPSSVSIYSPIPVQAIAFPSGTPVEIQANDHGFITGTVMRIIGIHGAGNDPILPVLDGQYTVTRDDDDNFTLDGTDGDTYAGVYNAAQPATCGLDIATPETWVEMQIEVAVVSTPWGLKAGIKLKGSGYTNDARFRDHGKQRGFDNAIF